jgi:hypothetical protein
MEWSHTCYAGTLGPPIYLRDPCAQGPQGLEGFPRCAALVASVCGLTTTPYQPIDTIADCKERKSSSSDRTWSTMKIVPGAIVMPSLMITVMPSVIVMG